MSLNAFSILDFVRTSSSFLSQSAIAIMRRAVICAVNAFVEATPTSFPAWVNIPASVSCAIVEPGTFTIPSVNIPLCFASRSAARVSAVSPDCDMTRSTESLFQNCLLYRNSLAISTRHGIPQISWRKFFPTSPA